MISISVKKQSGHKVNTKKIKKALTTSLEQSGVVSKTKVSVALVEEEEMLDLSRNYLKDNSLHNVLSFPYSETKKKFIFPPDKTKHLGEIVVCYPIAEKEAKMENKSVEEKIIELIEHGAQHLLGIHHK